MIRQASECEKPNNVERGTQKEEMREAKRKVPSPAWKRFQLLSRHARRYIEETFFLDGAAGARQGKHFVAPVNVVPYAYQAFYCVSGDKELLSILFLRRSLS